MSIIQKLTDYNKTDIYPFHMPGHKRRLFAAGGLKALYEADITEIDGFDNLHNPEGIIYEAEEKAAGVFGADETHFLVNGSTCGILAAICGSVCDKDIIYMSRACHRSAYNAAMLSGAKIKYIYPAMETVPGISSGITAEQVDEALSADEAEEALGRRLVVITSPTYEGIVSDVKKIADVCHRHNSLLLVDAAHGAHLGFSEGFPQSPVRLSADIVVTSLHKTLPSPTQTALIHINKECAAREGIVKMLKVFQSSSPSYVLMAGIDSCIELMSEKADILFKDYEALLDDFLKKAADLKYITLLSEDKLSNEEFAFDKSKLVISDRSGKYNGKELYDILLGTYRLQPEMAAGDYCLLMTSLADDARGFTRLFNALSDIDRAIEAGEDEVRRRSVIKRLYDRFIGRRVRDSIFASLLESEEMGYINMEPAEASVKEGIRDSYLNSSVEWIPAELAEGRISADFISFYPPGVPIAVPGEELTGQVVDEILKGIKEGLNVTGISRDKEIEVVWEKSST